MRARAPASSANLGPGYDTLAVALALYVEVEVEPADACAITAEGEGRDLPRDADHLAARAVRAVAGHDRFRIHVRSEIPVSRGLGSSAALAVAAAAAAGATDPLAVAAELEGHPENAAASVLGGLVTATSLDGVATARRLPLDQQLDYVVVVPDRTLSTKDARAALPAQVAHADAAFNLGRMGLLLAGLADRAALVPAATADRLHQPARTALFPESEALLRGLLDAGALASCWSGAGPSLLALCDAASSPRVRDAGDELLAAAGIAGRTLILRADVEGLQVEGSTNSPQDRPYAGPDPE